MKLNRHGLLAAGASLGAVMLCALSACETTKGVAEGTERTGRGVVTGTGQTLEGEPIEGGGTIVDETLGGTGDAVDGIRRDFNPDR